MFKKPFSFEGCIDKSEFRLSFVISFAGIIAVRIIGDIVNNTIIFLIIGIPVYWFMFAQSAKRCHDIGKSGWWQLIPFYVFWLLAADREAGGYRYGENPQEKNNNILRGDRTYFCKRCGQEVMLERGELRARKFICPECKSENYL
jgi:uncharacterized membrane protein YhaH (DUF805 family)/DNA-directed RNA polymerase subunit RPC12/RpoP